MKFRRSVVLIVLVLAGCLPQEALDRQAVRASVRAGRTVFLAGKMADEDLVAFTALAAACEPPALVLFDTPPVEPYLKDFLSAARAERVIAVGEFAEAEEDLARRLGVALQGKPLTPAEARDLLPVEPAGRVVVCPAEPRRQLLQAACLAGTLRAPLVVGRDDADALRQQLASAKEVVAVGTAVALCRDRLQLRVTALADEKAVAAAHVQELRRRGAIMNLVLANPADVANDLGKTSLLAPWVAVQKRAALVLTDATGRNATAGVREALKQPELASIDNLVIVAGLKAVPMERRPNPVAGKDTDIEMEPLTPAGEEPFTLAVGRLFHADYRVVPLTVARQRLLPPDGQAGPRKALIVSNPGGGLSLLETFSRNTAKELANCGYETTALFDEEVTKDEVRRLLPQQDIFLWEGHYRTMVDRYGLPGWTEPLRPSLVFLQSCLALNEPEALPLLRRGAVGVIGSSTRNYSGSGGAFSLAFFDALLYEHRTLGGSLRQAKNFLVAYAQLKEKRFADGAKLGGSNLRSAWAFTLWGDPTLRLPAAARPESALPAVRHEVRGKSVVLTIPEERYKKVFTQSYQAQIWPNARLAGLLSRSEDNDDRRLVPLLFAEVSLPQAPAGKRPTLHGKMPGRNWVFLWDARRKAGYLLVLPRAKDENEVRFQLKWESSASAG